MALQVSARVLKPSEARLLEAAAVDAFKVSVPAEDITRLPQHCDLDWCPLWFANDFRPTDEDHGKERMGLL